MVKGAKEIAQIDRLNRKILNGSTFDKEQRVCEQGEQTDIS